MAKAVRLGHGDGGDGRSGPGPPAATAYVNRVPGRAHECATRKINADFTKETKRDPARDHRAADEGFRVDRCGRSSSSPSWQSRLLVLAFVRLVARAASAASPRPAAAPSASRSRRLSRIRKPPASAAPLRPRPTSGWAAHADPLALRRPEDVGPPFIPGKRDSRSPACWTRAAHRGDLVRPGSPARTATSAPAAS